MNFLPTAKKMPIAASDKQRISFVMSHLKGKGK